MAKIIKNMKKEVITPLKDKGKVFRINRFLSNWRVLPFFILILDIIVFLLFNYVFISIGKLPEFVRNMDNTSCFSLKNMFQIELGSKVYKIFFFIMVVIDVLFVMKIKEAYSEDFFNVNQKGNARWTTLEEIKEQYLEIDEKNTPYEGNPGCIVARYGDKLYIDQTSCSNIYYGITRGGKDQIFVNPNIEVYSRAEIKPSLIVNDMKCDTYKQMKGPLEKEGYDVYLMNLIDPEHSMGDNPLTECIRLWKEGKKSKAELLAKATAATIFSDGMQNNGDLKYFSDSASDMCCAMILAHLDDCLSEDEKENANRKKQYERKVAAYKNLPEEEKIKAAALYEEKIEFSEDIIMEPDILAIPDTESFFETNNNEKCINFFSIVVVFTALFNIKIPKTDLTGVDIYFSNRPLYDRARLRYEGTEVAPDRTKGSIFSELLRKLGEFTYTDIAKMTAESTLDLEKIGFGDKPIAVFLGIPAHDKSKHFIPTIFIKQVYSVLSEKCMEVGACKRPIKFVLNEIGNMPKIEDLKTMISFGAGLGITFDIYIQDVKQLEDVYGKQADIIINNCANHIWIISNDPDTAKKFSTLLNKETIISAQRIGSKYSLHKTYHENIDEKPLLNELQLMQLREGECVVVRRTKRKDLKGRDVHPTPIFNSIENGQRMKYQYQYMPEIPNPKDVLLSEINPEDRTHINPYKRIWDHNKTFKKLELNSVVPMEKKLQDMSEKKLAAIKESLKKTFGYDVLERLEITDNMEIETLMSIIRETKEIQEIQKKALLKVLEGELSCNTY